MHGGANRRHQQPALTGELQDFSKRQLQIFLDIVSQRFQERNIENLRFNKAIAGKSFAYESRSIHASNAAKVLPDPVGAEMSVVFPSRMCRPTLLLGLGRDTETREEAFADDGMCPIERRRRDNLR